jgi:hypothetical protein
LWKCFTLRIRKNNNVSPVNRVFYIGDSYSTLELNSFDKSEICDASINEARIATVHTFM